MILRLNYANLIPKRRGPESSPESSLPRRRTPLSVAKWSWGGGGQCGGVECDNNNTSEVLAVLPGQQITAREEYSELHCHENLQVMDQ